MIPIFLMLNSTYLYSFLIIFSIISLLYFLYSMRPEKDEINNKIILKNLLESLDMELPEELKTLDNSSSDS